MSEILNWIEAAIGIDLTHFSEWLKKTLGLEASELFLGGIAVLLAVELVIHVKKRTSKRKRIY